MRGWVDWHEFKSDQYKIPVTPMLIKVDSLGKAEMKVGLVQLNLGGETRFSKLGFFPRENGQKQDGYSSAACVVSEYLKS